MSNRELILVEELRKRLCLVNLQPLVPHSWIWLPEADGHYTVKSAYNLILPSSVGETDHASSLIWTTPAPSNVCFFIWRSIINRLPTRDNLLKRRVLISAVDACCPRCRHFEESSAHALIKCPASSEVWALCVTGG